MTAFSPQTLRFGVVLMCSVQIISWVAAVPARADCARDRPYDAGAIAGGTFFSSREQTKFARNEAHYPLPAGASARYCFSRGCTGQLAVTWSETEQARLGELRKGMVHAESAAAELQFIKVAVLQMETWLYERVRALDRSTVSRLMQSTAGAYSNPQREDTGWITSSLASHDRFDKECATYAMEATQHLLVLANLGLIRHWNVAPPVYRFGIPGHWTAGLESRATCESYRFDLNSSASARHELHVRGEDPGALVQKNPRRFAHLLPGVDGNGIGRSQGLGRSPE